MVLCDMCRWQSHEFIHTRCFTRDVTGRKQMEKSLQATLKSLELLGKTHRMINSGYHPPEFFQDLWTTISSGQVWRGEIRNRKKDGSFYWVATTIVPMLDAGGCPLQYLTIHFDMTQMKQADEALQQSEERWQFALEGSGDGVWDWNVETNELSMDGLTAIRALKRMNPQLKIIASSGLAANGKLAEANSLGVNHFLPKPYTLTELLSLLRFALEDED